MLNLSKRFTIFASVQSAHSTNIEPHFNKTKTKMKQFYLLLTALFLQLASLDANAQTEVASYRNPLIFNESQLSSNASDEAEGKKIGNLLDGNPSTFWHTDYHGKVTEPHYLQVSFPEPISGIIQVDMTRRQGSVNGCVTGMYVTGSNNGEN